MNYLVMTLTKHVQGLYKEKYKTEKGNQKRSERYSMYIAKKA